MDIRALEEINEKEIELINKKKDKDIAEKQISVIDSQILYMREKNIEALNKMREGMFAAIKIHEHAIESKNMFEMNDQNHINEPAYEERDITILSHQNLIDNK
ncbi:hypothetical protein HLB35_00065 [Halomonas sp. TBZ9]|uniref:Uncharacterized protein n=1 Tax=Vreelandella azerica TaxID=2732867 RepID=A0A7Y3TUM0_9GAMM|nr:hypothetical protein [Halomonas azerica]NOG30557.1 hypothetical protein [Halomonas azerica]